MSNDKVRFVWVLQDKNDGKWLPKHKGAAWTDDDLACDVVEQADSLAKFASALGCDEAVDTVTEALLRRARRLRKGDET